MESGRGTGGAGAWTIDCHFRDAPLLQNLPVLLGLMGIWNTSFLGYPAMAILPYTQALAKLAPHIQQVLLFLTRHPLTSVLQGAPEGLPRLMSKFCCIFCCKNLNIVGKGENNTRFHCRFPDC